MPNSALPAVALLALADGVKLEMLPASHKIVSKEDVNRMCQPIQFEFKVGYISPAFGILRLLIFG